MSLIARISVCSIFILGTCCLPIDEGCNCIAEIVTYGELCDAPRKYPFQIEGPKSAKVEETVQINLVSEPMRFIKVVPNAHVPNMNRPLRVEYPMTIETLPPRVTTKSLENIITENTMPKKVYEYAAHVPPTVVPPPPLRNYNYEIEAPAAAAAAAAVAIPRDLTVECETRETVPQRLRGLESRIDRVLVPACEVPSSSSCQC